jgi:hypothetical protein
MFARRLSAFLALTLIGSAFASGPASAVTPLDLRVMEFNIEYGGTVVSFDSIVRAVQAADADVVGVEEGFGNVPRLADALGYPYYNVRLQVISRLPLIDAPGGNGLYLFVETAPGQVVALANVHLPAGPYSPNLVRRDAKRSTILEIERRVRVPAVEPAVTALTGLVDQGIPAMLLGDFNTPSRLDWTPETVGLREQVHYPVNWPTSSFIACLTSGNLLGWSIEPDTSIRKTRLLAGRSSFGIVRPLSPMRARRCSAFQGHSATSMLTEKGALSFGVGSS